MSTKQRPVEAKGQSTISKLLANVRRDVLRGKSAWKHIAELKRIGDVVTLQKVMEDLSRDETLARRVTGPPFPSRMEELATGYYDTYAGFAPEMRWLCALLTNYGGQLSKFLRCRDAYNSALLHGKFDDARQWLSAIEDEVGVSLWLLENKVNFLSISEGLESQKEYVNSLLSDEQLPGHVRMLSFFYSARAEKNNSSQSFLRTLDNATVDWDQHMKDYTYFKLALPAYVSITNLPAILSMDQFAPVVDKYVSLLHILRMTLLASAEPHTKKVVRNIVRRLLDYVDDPSLFCLSIAADDDAHISISHEGARLLSLLDLYTAGDYEEAISESQKSIGHNPIAFCAYDILAKSVVYTSAAFDSSCLPFLSGTLVNGLIAIYEKGEDYDASYEQLRKLSLTYCSENWALSLAALLVKHRAIESEENLPPNAVSGNLAGFPENPRMAEFTTGDNQKHFLNYLTQYFPASPAVMLQRYRLLGEPLGAEECGTSIPSVRLVRYRAERLRTLGRQAEAIEALKSLISNANTLVRQEAIYLLLDLLIDIGDVTKALRVIVDSYVRGERFYVRFPLRKVLVLAERHGLADVGDKLSLAVVYDVYSKELSKDRDVLLVESCEAFVEEYSCARPSELPSNAIQDRHSAFVYFLRNVCVQRVLDSFPCFHGSDEVELERVKVCNLLRKIDPANEDDYANEIKVITQRIITRNALHEMERSKIHVNVPGIKAALIDVVKQNCRRLQSLPADANTKEGDAFIGVVVPAGDGEVEFSVPGNESLNVFANVLIDIRDYFVSSREYGLDGYLSVGIRHGTLVGQLRKPLERRKLTTKLDVGGGSYQENTYWLNKDREMKDSHRRKLRDALADFSARSDNLINKLRKNWIQIKLEAKGAGGLFDYQVPIDEMLELYRAALPGIGDAEYVFDEIIKYLWKRTDDNLRTVREALMGEFKAEFNHCFDQLHRELAELPEYKALSELTSCVTSARTDIQNEINHVSSWFTSASKPEFHDYPLELPSQTGLEMMRNMYPALQISPAQNITDGPRLAGRTFKTMADIAFMIFDNMVKHGSIEGLKGQAEVSASRGTGFVRLTFKNPVRDEAQERKAAGYIAQFVPNDKILPSTAKIIGEGGTGLSKIKKLLAVDLGGGHEMFLSLDNAIFIVSIELAIDRLCS